MSYARNRICLSLALLCSMALLTGAEPATDVYDDPAKVDSDYAFQGEYEGEVGNEGLTYGLQVIARGKGAFRAVAYPGGLPGNGWTGEGKLETDGKITDGVLKFVGNEGTGTTKGDGTFQIFNDENQQIGVLKKITRESPTMGAKPPEGAVVLFDGKSADQFEKGEVTADGLLKMGVTSKMLHGDGNLHLEFRLPYMPTATGQGRGNSGCYLQGRYEVQILDSFGLAGKDNECGGIYSIKDPDLNMCFPPLTWQTYDIDYTAARYDDQGKKTSPATISVKHNGVLIHDKVKLDHATTAAPVKEGPEPGPLYLQDHGNPVRFRNIWWKSE